MSKATKFIILALMLLVKCAMRDIIQDGTNHNKNLVKRYKALITLYDKLEW